MRYTPAGTGQESLDHKAAEGMDREGHVRDSGRKERQDVKADAGESVEGKR